MRRIVTLLPLLAAALLYAEETAPQQLKVREMIQAVQNAPEGERYQKMNAFKQMIRSMNAEKRSAAIAQMQKAMESGKGKRSPAQSKAQTRTEDHREEGDGTMTRTRERKQMQNLQQQQTQQQMQQRNQMSNQQQINRVIAPQTGTGPLGPGSGQPGNRH